MNFVTITFKGVKHQFLVTGMFNNILPHATLEEMLNKIGVKRGQTYSLG